MKILMIMTSNFHRSGITNVVLNYYHSLTKIYDCKIDFVIPNRIDSGFIEKNQLQNTKFFILSKKIRVLNMPCYILMLRKIIKNGNYDIVHVHGSSSLLFFELFAAKLSGVKYRICHSHNVKTNHKILHKIFVPLFKKYYTHCLACSKEAGDWLFPTNDYKVITNGFNIEKFTFNAESRRIIRNKLDVSEDDILLGHIGLFNIQKNQIFLINIIEKIIKINNSYKLLLVGNGEKIEEIKKIVKQKKIENNVIFYGTTDEPEKLYSAMDMFLMPSKYEGLGLVALEAQLNGLPCILSKYVPKIVKVNSNVSFCDINNTNLDDWVDIILKSRSLNRNVNVNIFKDYSIEKCAGELYDFYVNILTKGDELDGKN